MRRHAPLLADFLRNFRCPLVMFVSLYFVAEHKQGSSFTILHLRYSSYIVVLHSSQLSSLFKPDKPNSCSKDS